MSRRQPQYMSPISSVPVPDGYFLQEEPDFSDGEMDPHFPWNEGGGPGHGPVHSEMRENMARVASPDVTELFRRKPEDHYVISQEVVMPEEPRYYYRSAALARYPQRRLPVSLTPSSHARPPAFYPPPHEEPRVHYEGVVYRSSPHLHRMLEARAMSQSAAGVMRRPPQLLAESSPQVSNLVRSVRPPSKPAVTVPTPRFYRRANVYKRPSTLCLQLPSTPDPSSRPVKTRLPSTMPALSLPPLGLRSPHFHMQHPQQPQHLHPPMTPTHASQRRHSLLERSRPNGMPGDQCEMEARGRSFKRALTARSAPPRCGEEDKEEEERVQKMILERGIHEFGDETTSNQDDPDTKCSELELLLNQYEQIFSSESEQAPGVSKPGLGSRRSSTRSRTKRKSSTGRLVGMMRPRLPPSLKALQKRGTSKSSMKHHSQDDDRLEIEQMTAEVLDTLLQDLSVGGLAGDTHPPSKPLTEVTKSDSRPGSKPITRPASRTVMKEADEPREASREVSRGSRTESQPGSRVESRDGSRGESRVQSRVNSRAESRVMSARVGEKGVKDIEEKRSSKNVTSKKSSQTFVLQDDIPTKTTFMQDKEKFTKFSNSSHTSFDQDKLSNDLRRSREQTPFLTEENKRVFRKEESPVRDMRRNQWKKGKHDEQHTASELHRSKSYIINLIDRALSRELGTIPEERTSKQYLNLDAKAAMDLITSKNIDTDMCLEITQAIAHSLSSVDNKEPSGGLGCPAPCCSTKVHECSKGETSKAEGELMFSTGNEEPLYIKQLKKLRWGHLKHIQREMKRLEDLERFLDSCSPGK